MSNAATPAQQVVMMQLTRSPISAVRQELLDSRKAWDDARVRYSVEANRYVVAWLEPETDAQKIEPSSEEAQEELTRLHTAILDAQQEFEAIRKRIRDG